MEKKTSRLLEALKKVLIMCTCSIGGGTGFYLAQKQAADKIKENPGNMEYYDRLG